ncbi:flavin reductase family protein [Paenibacillus lignilyticus]|uniref:Flavin reductase family protein n=1 Tax=Paenibacillus lignilyticus TaxID=1172615 RepID=A0ABS5CEB2_9BACL|nr:flavin reductase family protein [Paenibacillus lignilyticus]MBP3964092.1 flavin reductase family protein [Paenibacillus lignilyticus]
MKVDPATLPWRDAYKLLIGSVLPRPIAFVSTVDLQGHSNLAPFSFFSGICAKPMMVCFAPMIRGSDGKKKDTLANIEATKQFVINIVGERIAAQMNDCAIEFPPEVDEFTYTGLTKAPSHSVLPPRVQESDVQLECTLHQIVTLGELPGAGSLVIGRVVCVHVRDELFEGGKINSELLRPIGRMAGQTYTRAVSDTFDLERK